MRLLELTEKSKLNLEIHINGHDLEFKSKVYAKVNDNILIEPVRVNEKVVNFESGLVLIDILFIREAKSPIVWKRVLLKNIVYNNKTYYKVIPSADGFEVNRRSAFRLYIGILGVAQVGVNSMAYNIIVKDISESGYSFVSDEDIEKPLKSTVRLVFLDNDKSYILTGILVRKEKVNDKKYIYGCMLNSSNTLLNQYINFKQREILAKQSGISIPKMEPALLGVQVKDKKKQENKEKIRLQPSNKKSLENVMKEDRRNIFKRMQ